MRLAESRACGEALVSLGLPRGSGAAPRNLSAVALALGGPKAEDSPESSLAPPRAGHPRAEGKGEVATRGGTGAGGGVGRLAQGQPQLRGGDPDDPEVTSLLKALNPSEPG